MRSHLRSKAPRHVFDPTFLLMCMIATQTRSVTLDPYKDLSLIPVQYSFEVWSQTKYVIMNLCDHL